MPDIFAPEIPPCPVFGTCGGCQYQNLPYDEELRLKTAQLRDLMQRQLDLASFDLRPPIASPKVYHYRNRLDLKLVKTRRGTLHIGFSPSERGPVVEISACPIAMEAISAFVPKLREEAAARLTEKHHIANLTVRCGDEEQVRWGGIGKRSLRLEEKDYFSTRVAGREIFYSLDTFFQANLSILPLLADTLRSLPVWSSEALLFDLYGGVGFLGIVVHDLARGVVNIEENVHAVRLAHYNVERNGIKNIAVCEGRVEDLLPGMLADLIYDGNVVLVDPPRAGLSRRAVELLSGLPKVRHLIYLSCNPASLAVNLRDLSAGPWQVVSLQPFDFFPRTRHLESLVLLKNKLLS